MSSKIHCLQIDIQTENAENAHYSAKNSAKHFLDKWSIIRERVSFLVCAINTIPEVLLHSICWILFLIN